MKRALFLSLSLAALLLCQPATAQQTPYPADSLPLVPMPAQVTAWNEQLTLPHNLYISTTTGEEKDAALFLKAFLKQQGFSVSFNPQSVATPAIFLSIQADSTRKEAYHLTINATSIHITAGGGAGLFYGIQTLMQLFPANGQTTTKGATALRQVDINDAPAFGWRGLMLDVCRHIFPISFIKQTIDQMATYKLNTFHWHLTDDQGWRIEIKKYPLLTSIGAYRKETIIGWQPGYKTIQDRKFDGKRYGGYYSQQEIRDIVAYAAQRHITVVPEIEMPGHSVAILSAYPDLACKPGKYAPLTYWGVSDDVICPNEKAIHFFEDVLTEVCNLFPGQYVHIGGDECPVVRWEESDDIQQLMKREGITEVRKVQGWFNRQIEQFLATKGRKLIGWDEILEGGISPNATIMSWRGEKGGIQAANIGNDVVMTPASGALYFDHAQGPLTYEPENTGRRQGNATLPRVYAYNPIPKEIDSDKRAHILGMQANLWTEYIPTVPAAQYMLYPRLWALAEAAWTPLAQKDYNSFTHRIRTAFGRAEQLNLNARLEPPVPQDTTSNTIRLYSNIPNARIFYTTNGQLPTTQSDEYTSPVTITRKTTVKAINVLKNGRTSPPVEFTTGM